MTSAEQALLDEAGGARPPKVLVRTRTRVDTGRWWRRSPVWLAVFDDDLVVLAVSRRKYFKTVALTDCRSSRYCHATGRLVIAPSEDLDLNQLSLSPSRALEVLDAIGAEIPSISNKETSIHP